LFTVGLVTVAAADADAAPGGLQAVRLRCGDIKVAVDRRRRRVGRDFLAAFMTGQYNFISLAC